MNHIYIDKLIEFALLEDYGFQKTPDYILFKDKKSKALIESQKTGILAGINIAERVFKFINSDIKINILKQDGKKIKKGDHLLELDGPIADILSGERIALNFLQHMSGIATKVRNIINKLPKSIKLLDTRKTIPGLRYLQKYAVKIGGGDNHRFMLTDLIMLKTNHIRFFGGVKEAVKNAKKHFNHRLKIEVEVTSKNEFFEAIDAGVDIIMLDNFSPSEIKNITHKKENNWPLLEASGGINENNILEYANTGIDLISMGALTHTITPLNIHMVLK